MSLRKLTMWCAFVVASGAVAQAQDKPLQEQSPEELIRTRAGELADAFNKGDAPTLAKAFAPEGEFISEDGTIYRGHEEITALFKSFFEQFPGAKLMLNVESIRALGSALAIEEGGRSIDTKDDQAGADLRYVAIWSKSNDGWLLSSYREIADDPPPTSHQQLEPLAWLIGDWVNEGDDGVVNITYRWSEDQNYILGEYEVQVEGKPASKSTQRIGWDASDQRIRSWLFDADGGFSEGKWTPYDEGWLVYSSTVLPTGQTGSASVRFIPKEDDRFDIKGSNRLIGGVLDEDFEVTVVRRPPAPTGK